MSRERQFDDENLIQVIIKKYNVFENAKLSSWMLKLAERSKVKVLPKMLVDTMCQV